jgi:pimeloyl-ACP methyl ester carboxylesterase
MSTPIPLTFVVKLDGVGETPIAAWAFLPSHGSSPDRWAVCFPGATYTGLGYYDRQVPGCPPDTYSMARWFSARGIGVITIDNLGTGKSRVPASGWQLDRFLLADAYRFLVEQVRERLLCGMLVPALAPMDADRLFLVGIGHSMGGMLLTQVQATSAPFDAIALLGWASATMLTQLPGTSPDLFEQVAEAITPDGSLPTSLRPLIRPWFFSPAVSEAVIAADETDATVAPAAWMREMQPHALVAEAARITCPLFLGFGGVDSTATPHKEVAAYPHVPSLTLFVQQDSHHCTNLEPGRFALWQALVDWMIAQAALARLSAHEDVAATQPLAL